jgi:ATP-dependent Lon protease
VSTARRRLPLFPLPLVLFPGVPLPLHIFEPRYRQLLADCLATDHEFGVIFRPEDVAERDLPIGHVGCMARIENSERLPDGRANILIRGGDRFVLERFVDSPLPYHVGETTPYVDAAEPLASLAPIADRVRALFARVGAAARALADDPDALPTLPDDPTMLAYAISALVDMDPPARQRLLTSRSASERLRQIEALLAPAVESLELRAVVHDRAKSNGHGPHPDA